MKTVFFRCDRRRRKNQVVDRVFAVSAWEWRMLNSLAILVWLKAALRNELAAGPGALLAERANDIWYEECAAFRDGHHDIGNALRLHFGALEEGLGPGEGFLKSRGGVRGGEEAFGRGVKKHGLALGVDPNNPRI